MPDSDATGVEPAICPVAWAEAVAHAVSRILAGVAEAHSGLGDARSPGMPAAKALVGQGLPAILREAAHRIELAAAGGEPRSRDVIGFRFADSTGMPVFGRPGIGEAFAESHVMPSAEASEFVGRNPGLRWLIVREGDTPPAGGHADAGQAVAA